MIQIAPGTKVYLACRPVSMRYGFDGLAAQVKQVLDADPFSGHIFVFRSKRTDYLKTLYWDGSGLCLFAKRLESGRFAWPPIVDGQHCADPRAAGLATRSDRLASNCLTSLRGVGLQQNARLQQLSR
jgi:transposase